MTQCSPDIVEQLRSVSGCTQKTFMHRLDWEDGRRIINEAATEIERLRTQAATPTNLKAAIALMQDIDADDHHGRYGRLAREAIAALRTLDAAQSEREPHGDGYCGCTERCRDRGNCQYDLKPEDK